MFCFSFYSCSGNIREDSTGLWSFLAVCVLVELTATVTFVSRYLFSCHLCSVSSTEDVLQLQSTWTMSIYSFPEWYVIGLFHRFSLRFVSSGGSNSSSGRIPRKPLPWLRFWHALLSSFTTQWKLYVQSALSIRLVVLTDLMADNSPLLVDCPHLFLPASSALLAPFSRPDPW